jgi:hypothetical protein
LKTDLGWTALPLAIEFNRYLICPQTQLTGYDMHGVKGIVGPSWYSVVYTGHLNGSVNPNLFPIIFTTLKMQHQMPNLKTQ